MVLSGFGVKMAATKMMITGNRKTQRRLKLIFMGENIGAGSAVVFTGQRRPMVVSKAIRPIANARNKAKAVFSKPKYRVVEARTIKPAARRGEDFDGGSFLSKIAPITPKARSSN